MPNSAPHDHLIRGRDHLEKTPDFKLIGRDKELDQLTAVLMRKNANSILLVGSGGVGCSALCQGLQLSKDDDNATVDLISKRFYWLDSDGLFSSGDPSIINESFAKTLRTLEKTNDAVLIIDDMKDFVEAAKNNGCSNLINALMRAIKQKKFQAIMETRDVDLGVVLSCHSDMKESFTMIDTQEPNIDVLKDIVKVASNSRLASHHGIKISEEALNAAIDMTNKHLVSDLGLSRAQPERSLTLLDRALTTYRQEAHAKDPKIAQIQAILDSAMAQLNDENYDPDNGGKTIEELQSIVAVSNQDISDLEQNWAEHQNKIRAIYKDMRKGEDLVRELEDRLEAQLAEEAEQKENVAEHSEEQTGGKLDFNDFLQAGATSFDSDAVTTIKTKIQQFEREVRIRKEEFAELTAEINDGLELTEDHVLREFSSISGIPVNTLTQNELEKLKHLEANLSKRVMGQEHAVEKLSDQIQVAKAGLKDPGKPEASFLFLGPSGVGKTEIAKALAEQMLDDESALLRFDMSEYMEKHSIAKLIGAPPGYEGYEAGGILTNEMRKNSKRIILFDEIEKAHDDIFNVFLQILDDGRLTDNRGLTVSFEDSIILMTTNIGTPEFLGNDDFSVASKLALAKLDERYRPEFLNRFNGRENIVCFNPLQLPIIELIAKGNLKKLNKMINNRMPDISVNMPEQALVDMCKAKYDPVNGARGVVGYIQSHVKPAIAKTILHDQNAKGVIHVEFDNEAENVVVHPPKLDDEQEEILSATKAFSPALTN